MTDGPVIGNRQIGATAGHDFNNTIDYISRRLLDAICIWLERNDIIRKKSNDTVELLNGRLVNPSWSGIHHISIIGYFSIPFKIIFF